ncbi:very-short-patch-repair endonuclease [Rhizobium sp. PP-F2F-G20b]|nr:very-short-patch-repair endonuclease [Rhizobium sp. PP-F2F-G20b]
MAHSNITPLTRTRAKRLRREYTKAEQIMWNILRDFHPRGARLPRETPIGPYIADVAWLSARIVIEADGDSHETDAGKQHDRRRDAFMMQQGFNVLRFNNDQIVDNPDHVTLLIESKIAELLAEVGAS